MSNVSPIITRFLLQFILPPSHYDNTLPNHYVINVNKTLACSQLSENHVTNYLTNYLVTFSGWQLYIHRITVEGLEADVRELQTGVTKLKQELQGCGEEVKEKFQNFIEVRGASVLSFYSGTSPP